MGGVPGGTSNHEWSKGEDTSNDSGDPDFHMEDDEYGESL